MYSDLLLPTDGSDGTRQAIRHGLAIADRFEATVHALAVRSEGPYGSLESDAEREAVDREVERALERVGADARRRGLETVTAVRDGVPHEEILAYADETGIDVIVMGTHGRTGVDRVLVGSVTERVVREAAVPVVTVRARDDPQINDPETAVSIAREALSGRDYETVALTDDPHRTSGSWIVPLEADGESIHVHVDATTRDARVAHLDS
ncbi:universal stress protein [Natronobiforma cellulositropha]|uniref:universal stress protein n=1 Tax=Natronobiforma cellulositropha TaxID=1679076 RepID=UPI0021D57C25|nr:universal stress protein [Natronobiforma cellulositropha]